MSRRIFSVFLAVIISFLNSQTIAFAEEVSNESEGEAQVVEEVYYEDTEVSPFEPEEDDDTITVPQGVTVAGKDMSGLTKGEVKKVIEHEIETYSKTVFTLSAQGNTSTVNGSDLELIPYDGNIVKKIINCGNEGNLIERYKNAKDIEVGRGVNIELELTSDAEAISNYLLSHIPHLENEPIDNRIVKEDNEFKFIEGRSGTAVNCDKSAEKIVRFLTYDWTGADAQIDLELETREPRGTREELEQVKDLMGSCSTDFSTSGSSRIGNLQNGASKINESIIYPGDEYSVSQHLGTRNAENGYFLAASYENGTTVDTYGGGVCQISTTLYNAVIEAELEIVERSPHSMVVTYVDPSMDAAISDGSKDFIFKNNQEYPIYIEGYTSGKTLCFNIYGKDERPANREVRFESEILETRPPFPAEKYVADGSLPAGQVVKRQGIHTGYRAQLWKIVLENGTEISREVFNQSSYRASPAIYSVGTAGSLDPIGIQNAINSQDGTTIRLAVGNISPDEAAAQQEAAAAAAAQQAIQENTLSEETTGE